MPKVAVFAGSFDPFTLGHQDIVEQGLQVFDKIIIAVASNPAKTQLFSAADRVSMIQQVIDNDKLTRVVVREVPTHQSVVNFACSVNAGFLVRGLRNGTDYEYESQIEQINLKLNSSIKTVYLSASKDLSCVSSSAVKSLMHITHGADVIYTMVHPIVFDEMESRFL